MNEEEITNGAGEGDATKAQSLMERMRAKREEQASRREVDIDLPGYEGELVVRYTWLGQDQRKIVADKVMRETKNVDQRNEFITLDTIIASCLGIFARVGDELVPLEGIVAEISGDPTDAEAPVVYDARLAAFLGLEARTARETLLGVFGGNDILLGQHALQLTRWMADTTREVNTDFFGLGVGPGER